MGQKIHLLKAYILLLIAKWRYYGVTREQLALCRKAMNYHNAGSLAIASLVSSFLMVFLSFYPGGPGHVSSVYYLFAALQLVVFGYSKVVLNRVTLQTIPCFCGTLFFTANLLCFSIYICIFDQGLYAIRFLLFFISFEVVFIFGALLNLFYNFMIVCVFFLVYTCAERVFNIKMPENSYYDVLNVGASCVIAMTMNWYLAHVFIKGVITTISLEKEKNRYHEESIHDQLTGLNNRRSFEQSVHFYISVCRHVRQTVCVIMMDIDFFKSYNDRYGHQKGDGVLQAIGDVLRQLIDEEKVYAARVGGEEFIVLWTENRIIEAERVALKLRQMIIDKNIPHIGSMAAPCVTASIGLYIMRGGSQDSPEELYQAADSALYKAKESGRNCVVRHDSATGVFEIVKVRNHTELSR